MRWIIAFMASTMIFAAYNIASQFNPQVSLPMRIWIGCIVAQILAVIADLLQMARENNHRR